MSLPSRLARLSLLLPLAGCSPGPPATDAAGAPRDLSPRPRLDVVETLREDLAAPRHPRDGGGSAWLDTDASTPLPLQAGQAARLVVVYEAGPLGVAVGGAVFLQASSFWGWSPPHDLDPELPGYTEVSTTAPGVELRSEALGANLLAAQIGGRELAPGERLRFVYGAGAQGARVDRYAERSSRLWIAVDGDGDGVRGLVADSPAVDVEAAPPAGLVVTLPSVARPGESARLTLATVDLLGNAGQRVATTVRLESSPAGLLLPADVELEPDDGGRLSLEIRAPETGVFRVLAAGADGLAGRSNPIFVTPKLPRLLWADLHGHSQLSDGTQTPEDYFRYAREVAGLDVAALTDHDHWGMQPLALHPELWERIQGATREAHEPHRFVTLLGYEWTSWLHGHRHVLYFADGGEVFSSLDPDYEHPRQLWSALAGVDAMTFAHHSAGEPVPTNWTIPPDPLLEPVTEIVSVHGSSEALDSPGVLRGPVEGNFVRDALDRGYRLGFIGSGDSHDGHPGLAGIAAPSSGLAALLTEEHTREGVREALTARRVYATNGPRILLHATLDGQPMGSEVAPGEGLTDQALVVLALTEEPISRLDVVRGGRVIESVRPAEDDYLLRLERTVPALGAGEYLYLRVVQIDGGAAWSSPFFGPP